MRSLNECWSAFNSTINVNQIKWKPFIFVDVFFALVHVLGANLFLLSIFFLFCFVVVVDDVAVFLIIELGVIAYFTWILSCLKYAYLILVIRKADNGFMSGIFGWKCVSYVFEPRELIVWLSWQWTDFLYIFIKVFTKLA